MKHVLKNVWKPAQVIENHSKQQERQRLDDTTEVDQREEETQEEAAEEEEEDVRVEEGDTVSPDASFASQSSPYTDGRLVKSHSEAPIGSPKGQWTGGVSGCNPGKTMDLHMFIQLLYVEEEKSEKSSSELNILTGGEKKTREPWSETKKISLLLCCCSAAFWWQL